MGGAFEPTSGPPGLGALPRLRRDPRRLRAAPRCGPAVAGPRARARTGGRLPRARDCGGHRPAHRRDRPLALRCRPRRRRTPRRRAQGRRRTGHYRRRRRFAPRRGRAGPVATFRARGRQRRRLLRGQGVRVRAPLPRGPPTARSSARKRWRRSRVRRSRFSGVRRLRSSGPGASTREPQSPRS